MKVRTLYNITEHGNGLEAVSTDDCRVVPNMALSVKEILRRFSAGTLAPVDDPRYIDVNDEDLDSDVVEVHDLSDLTEMSERKRRALQNFVDEVNNINASNVK